MTVLDAYFLRALTRDRPVSINRESHSCTRTILDWRKIANSLMSISLLSVRLRRLLSRQSRGDNPYRQRDRAGHADRHGHSQNLFFKESGN